MRGHRLIFLLEITAHMIGDLLQPGIEQPVILQGRDGTPYQYVNFMQSILCKMRILQEIIHISVQIIVGGVVKFRESFGVARPDALCQECVIFNVQFIFH